MIKFLNFNNGKIYCFNFCLSCSGVGGVYFYHTGDSGMVCDFAKTKFFSA